MRHPLRAALALALAAALAAPLSTAPGLVAPALAASDQKPGMRPVTVHAEPIQRFQRNGDATRFGEFEFRGGLILSSNERRFGSFSGIDIGPDGSRFIAVADIGRWLTGRLVRASGHLVGVEETRSGVMLDDKGRPLLRRSRADAEAVRLAPDGSGAYVTFEQSNTLKFYRFKTDPSLARATPVALPKSARGMVGNQGLETVAIAPASGPLAGSPVIVSEQSLDAAGNHRAWVVRGPRAGAFSVVRSDDYDVTDGAFMPDGDLLLLERRVTALPVGVNMRLRRIPAGAIRPGAVVDGPVMMEASMADQIDNMEGLAVSTDDDGRMRVTLVSDDNQNPFQRTLLLEFVWLGPSTALN